MTDATNLHGEHARTKSPIALLLVDVINDLEFDGGEDLLEPALAMASHLATLKRRASGAGVPCIYANDNWGRWRSNFQQIVEACRGKRGWPVAEQLLPDDDDYFVLKAKHSAFYETPLDLLLRHLGAQTLVIAGIATDSCVLFTASDAYMRDYRIVLPTDCMASEQAAWHDAGLAHMDRVLKAELVREAEIDFAALAEPKPATSGKRRE